MSFVGSFESGVVTAVKNALGGLRWTYSAKELHDQDDPDHRRFGPSLARLVGLSREGRLVGGVRLDLLANSKIRVEPVVGAQGKAWRPQDLTGRVFWPLLMAMQDPEDLCEICGAFLLKANLYVYVVYPAVRLDVGELRGEDKSGLISPAAQGGLALK